MANKKITNLTELTTMVGADMLPIVTDISTLPVTKKISGTNLASYLRGVFNKDYENVDGWISGIDYAPSYVSSTSIRLTVDARNFLSKGDKIRIYQSSWKYFYVVSVSYTTPYSVVTLMAGSDYTVANAAITSFSYSHADNPTLFPNWFNYVPTWSSATGVQPGVGNGTLTGRFNITGKIVTCTIRLVAGSTTTFGTDMWLFAMPITSGPRYHIGVATATDVTSGYMPFHCRLDPYATNLFLFYRAWEISNANALSYSSPVTWANGDMLEIQLAYEV